MEPSVPERRLYVCSGVPIEVSRKGKASPGHTHEVWVGLEGAGIPFPIEPDRRLSEAFERRNSGFHLANANLWKVRREKAYLYLLTRKVMVESLSRSEPFLEPLPR